MFDGLKAGFLEPEQEIFTGLPEKATRGFPVVTAIEEDASAWRVGFDAKRDHRRGLGSTGEDRLLGGSIEPPNSGDREACTKKDRSNEERKTAFRSFGGKFGVRFAGKTRGAVEEAFIGERT